MWVGRLGCCCFRAEFVLDASPSANKHPIYTLSLMSGKNGGYKSGDLPSPLPSTIVMLDYNSQPLSPLLTGFCLSLFFVVARKWAPESSLTADVARKGSASTLREFEE